MSLLPATGVLGTVAKINRTDPEAARTLVAFGLYESMLDQADAARDEVQPYVLAKMAETLVTARKALLRNHVGKSIDSAGNSEDLAFAQGMAMLETHIEKGLSDILAGLFERKHPRDERGRWIRQPIGSSTTASQSPEAAAIGLHNEAEQHVEQWKKSGLIDENSYVTVQHRKTDFSRDNKPLYGPNDTIVNPVRVKDLRAQLHDIEFMNDPMKLEMVSLDRSTLPLPGSVKHRAALDIMATAMGDNGSGMNARLLRGLPMDSSGKVNLQNENASLWNRPTSEGDRQSFRRMSMTGSLLGSMAAPGSTMDTIGGLAQLVGDLGPEAEKVLGPGIRRTAYRYRGTERRPDRAMVNSVNEATDMADRLDAKRGGDQVARERSAKEIQAARDTISTRARGRKDPVAQTNHYWMDEAGSRDQKTLGMRGDAAVVNLLDALPDRTLTELGVASGELPPSQGVIINADGHVVTQAMGYNGDHYLPFDLKNLNALHGGQYVRTRANGGPTTEDIYTGLLSGARQIQVVSNSGVFTVEFDPDLRGGRRYSDKAARMISRYGKLLETIVGGGLYQTDLSAEQKSQIRTQAMAGANGDKTTFDTNVTILTNRALLEGSVNDDEDIADTAEAAGNFADTRVNQAIEAARKNKQPGLTSTQRGQILFEAKREFEAKHADEHPSVRKLKLDGPGYDRALKTLRQEFPYYIRQAKWESLPDYLRARGINNDKGFRAFSGTDAGHVKPGQNHFARVEEWAKPASTSATTETTATTGSVRSIQGSALGEKKVTVAEATAVGTPYMRTLAHTVGDALAVLAANASVDGRPIGDDYESEKEAVSASTAGQFVNWKMRQIESQPGVGTARLDLAFAQWLTDPTTSTRAKDRVFAAIPEAVKTANSVSGFDPAVISAAGAKLKDLVSLKDPYAAKEEDPVLAQVNLDNPRPQSFPGIPDTVGPEEYVSYLNTARVQDQLLASTIEDFTAKYETDAGPDHEKIGISVAATLERFNNEKTEMEKSKLRSLLEARQKAWAFITARYTGQKLKEIGGTTGDAAPLAKGLAGRRKIVFHKAQDSYSQRMRQALGL